MLPRVRVQGGVRLSFSPQVYGPWEVQKVWVASGRHVAFSSSEGFAQLQMAQIPPGWQAESWGVALASPVWRA